MISIEKARNYIEEHCDPLYAAYFSVLFCDGDLSRFLKELSSCQNPDGGFGHGLEPDFQLPASSPMAVTKAFQMMETLKVYPAEMVSKAVAYLEDTFIPERQGWKTVSKKVNDYPHAPWWEYQEDTEGTVIDLSWGNPSSELIGYLNMHRSLVKGLDVEGLKQNAVDRLLSSRDTESEHEIFCYIAMYDHVEESYQEQMRPVLLDIISRQVIMDDSVWDTYVPRPLDYLIDPAHPLFSAVEEGAEKHLDFIISRSNGEGLWEPNWSWGQYEDVWAKAKENWKALLAVRWYTALKNFRRL